MNSRTRTSGSDFLVTIFCGCPKQALAILIDVMVPVKSLAVNLVILGIPITLEGGKNFIPNAFAEETNRVF
jgi:hypothetical protein